MDEQTLTQQFEQDSRSEQPFIVLTLAAGLIATLGLLANTSAVVIGAMLITPWMLPLRAAAFAIFRPNPAAMASPCCTSPVISRAVEPLAEVIMAKATTG